MQKLTDQVRLLVGLENLLRKARRRFRECEREEGGAASPRGKQYTGLIARLSREIDSFEKGDLEAYLAYVEESLLSRIASRVEETKEQMLHSAEQLVDERARLHEIRSEYTDALDRVRMLRERLDLEMYRPGEVHFGLGMPPSGTDRRRREAFELVKHLLRS